MQLYFSPLSPFVRKVRVLALETGLMDRIQLITVNAWQPPEALADGIAEAAVLRRMESIRPDGERSDDWGALQAGAMARGLDALERECETFGDRFDMGQIACACALGYLDLRFAADQWRATRPRLSTWFARVNERPSMLATEPVER